MEKEEIREALRQACNELDDNPKWFAELCKKLWEYNKKKQGSSPLADPACSDNAIIGREL